MRKLLILAMLVALAMAGVACGAGGAGGDEPGTGASQFNALRGRATPGTVITVAGKTGVAKGNGDYEVRDFSDGTHTATARRPNGSTASRTFTWRPGQYDKHYWSL